MEKKDYITPATLAVLLRGERLMDLESFTNPQGAPQGNARAPKRGW